MMAQAQYERISNDSGSSKTEKDRRTWGCSIVMVFVGLVLAVSSLLFMILLSPQVGAEENDCVGGKYLNQFEQMHCWNDDHIDILDVSFNSSEIKLYILSGRAEETFLNKSVNEKKIVSSGDYVFYRFEAMDNSIIEAEIYSSDLNDDCYLIKGTDFDLFTHGKKFKSIEHGKGSIKVSYEVDWGNEFYFIVDHGKGGTATASFDMDFHYRIYNTTPFTPEYCSHNACRLKYISSAEVIVLENTGAKTHEAQMVIVSEVPLFFKILVFGIPCPFLLCGLLLVFCGIAPFLKKK